MSAFDFTDEQEAIRESVTRVCARFDADYWRRTDETGDFPEAFIAAMAEGLATLGIRNEVLDDGIIIDGGSLGGGVIRTFHDHRIAMSFAVAALRAATEIRILDCDHVATSFPGFDALARGLGLQISAMTD